MPFVIDETLQSEMAEFLRLTKMSAAEAARQLDLHPNTLTKYLHERQQLDRRTRLAMSAILKGLQEFRASSH